MTQLERMAQSYWNAFRDGFVRVGGKAKDYPKWTQGPNQVRAETMRCFRHAVEELRDFMPPDMFEALFEEPLEKRPVGKKALQDDLMAERLRG